MLWYKGWLETRFRLLFALGVTVFYLVLFHSMLAKPPSSGAKPFAVFISFSIPSLLVVFCAMLAGAGIATQAAFGRTRGLHGSMLFTLTLPVSRFRLLAVRASLGWLEMTGAIGVACCGMWVVFPLVRATVTAVEMFEYWGTLILCASAVYFLSVLLATFLDDQWRIWGTMIACGALWGLPRATHLPAFADIFRATGEGSPVLAQTVPWAAIAFSVVLAAMLFFAALKVVQSREY